MPSLNLNLFLANIAMSCAIVVGGIVTYCLLLLFLNAYFKIANKFFKTKNYKTSMTVLTSIVKYLTGFIVVLSILNVFGASKESILALASVGSIALGFGARGIAEDFITGASILFENQFRVGDNVEINGKSGAVESIGLRITTVRGFDGNLNIFPNSSIKIVTNMSKDFNRAVVSVHVSYDESAEKIIALLKNEMSTFYDATKDLIAPPQVLGVTEFSPHFYTIKIIADSKIGENWEIERGIRLCVLKSFSDNNITYPVHSSTI